MAITIQNDTSYHEAGHCFIAYLASDFFELEFVTADSTKSKKQDASALGGIKGQLKKDPESLKTEEHDLMLLMSLAGMAADDINHSDGVIDSDFYDNKVFTDKLKSNKYGGDAFFIAASLQRLAPQWNVKQRVYTINCQKLLYKLFTEAPTKSILLELRNLIHNATNKTLSGTQVYRFLKEKGLENWKQENWNTITEKRQHLFK